MDENIEHITAQKKKKKTTDVVDGLASSICPFGRLSLSSSMNANDVSMAMATQDSRSSKHKMRAVSPAGSVSDKY